MEQQQFLDVIDRDEAERRFRAVLDLRPLEPEEVPLAEALGRVLAADIAAPFDVPGFDRANVDGFALRAADTYGASEDRPCLLGINAERIATGVVPAGKVLPGTATSIATGAMLPRGADAVIMVEYTDVVGVKLMVVRPAAPGANITFAGTDIGRGETVLWHGELLTSRETGVLAAIGQAMVPVIRRPRVAIVSTGDELRSPGTALPPGTICDSNSTILSDAVRELGGIAVPFGIIPDDLQQLDSVLRRALNCDVVLLSGGTSKGPGDVACRAIAELGEPGIVVHGVALKPGKPLCLAAVKRPGTDRRGRTVPVVVLPGFPTSAIFTFQEFVAPVVRALAGRTADRTDVVPARLPVRVNSERGRTEYLLVNLVTSAQGADAPRSEADAPRSGELIAYPMGKGSGSVTAFSRADGFIIIPRQREYVEAGALVDVHLLSKGHQPADLVAIGSHCVGLDYLLGKLQDRGFRTRFLAVGSMGGLEAARRGQCDIAGVHLLDPGTGVYNRPYLSGDLELIPGYGRLQGLVHRPGDRRFEGLTVQEAVARALADPDCMMVNRNRGSGTRILIDRLLAGAAPPGYLIEARSHNAVAAAVAQGRADWGLAIEHVARQARLGFIPHQEEQFDFMVPCTRKHRECVAAFIRLLESAESRAELAACGCLRQTPSAAG